jgi:hypothetical protein
VTGTIKKNIQTTTIYIFCVVWVLTVPKYIDIRLNIKVLKCPRQRAQNCLFCLGLLTTTERQELVHFFASVCGRYLYEEKRLLLCTRLAHVQ